MRILIVTQVVDTDHPILGFFHQWITETAAQCESVEVICLQAGRHSLPANVTVHSLGKEVGAGRLTYVIRFYSYIWQQRRQYDAVFVHMNQIYVLLGWLPWMLLRKPVGLWYMHGSVSLSLRVASRLVRFVFTGSPESFRLTRSNVLVTGHGINTSHFKPLPNTQKEYDLITVGRITPSKNLKTVIRALAEVSDQGTTLAIVGTTITAKEQEHETELKQLIHSLGLTERVFWKGKVNQADLPRILNRARVFVTAAQNGSLDKAMLEALACGVPVVSMAPGSRSLPLGPMQTQTRDGFVTALNRVTTRPPDTADAVHYVQQNHSLPTLISKICTTLVP